MSDIDDREVAALLEQLSFRGVQLWHNRGRLYAAPWSRVSAAERVLLNRHKADIIEGLKCEPPLLQVPQDLVAPRPPAEGSYEGVLPRKPWDYEVAVVMPHLGALDLLETAVACWRAQSVSPYIVVIDTGPYQEEERDVEELRAVDLEIHYLASHGWRHSSSPVSAALDLAFAVCQQPAALLTHTDVFPRQDTLLEQLLSRLSTSCPVLGYQMSKRVGSEEWRQCVSHTLTLVDLKAMRKHRVTWNLLAALEADDEVEQRYLGWPDTETWFGRSLRAAGIVPEFLGTESNASVYQTDLIVHWRSAPSVRHYLPDQAELRHPGLSDWLARTRRFGVASLLPQEFQT